MAYALGQETEERAAARLNLRKPVLLMRRALLLRLHNRVLEITLHTRRRATDGKVAILAAILRDIATQFLYIQFHRAMASILLTALFSLVAYKIYYKILIRYLSSFLIRFRFRCAPRHNFISFRSGSRALGSYDSYDNDPPRNCCTI